MGSHLTYATSKQVHLPRRSRRFGAEGGRFNKQAGRSAVSQRQHLVGPLPFAAAAYGPLICLRADSAQGDRPAATRLISACLTVDLVVAKEQVRGECSLPLDGSFHGRAEFVLPIEKRSRCR